MKATIPYTYVVGWTILDRYYYGVRYAENCSPMDFWVTYFTSSKVVKLLREKYGEPDIKEIRKTFDDKFLAQKWEKKILSKLNVLHNEKWLNENIGGVINPDIIKEKLTGRKLSEETKKKMREAKLGTKRNVPAWNKGKVGVQVHSDETKKQIREFNLGKKKSEETKRKISISVKNRVAT
jgi:hypothetical protein